mmetsp:Transcript_16962/g.47580  ORF Transcript_16962/g.47580 Transcript_16962/m.47580 type:complete len:488 (+) Transcript_16962:74-1537(+)
MARKMRINKVILLLISMAIAVALHNQSSLLLLISSHDTYLQQDPSTAAASDDGMQQSHTSPIAVIVDNNKNQKNNTPTLYMHIGPGKMATTYLQDVFGDAHNRHLLKEHGYLYMGTHRTASEMVLGHSWQDSSTFIEGGITMTREEEDKHVAQSANQFFSSNNTNNNDTPFKMTEKFNRLLRLAKASQLHPIIVFEKLSSWKAGHIQALVNAVADDFHVHLIVGYRRFFDHAASRYNQHMKPKSGGYQSAKLWLNEQNEDGQMGQRIPRLNTTTAVATFKELVGQKETSGNLTMHLSLAALRKFQAAFSSSTYSIIDMHDQSKPLLNKVVCDILRSDGLCQSIDRFATTPVQSNPSYSFDADEIALDAYEVGLIRNDREEVTRESAANAIAAHQRELMKNDSTVDIATFPRVCPPNYDEEFNAMLQVSLSLETGPLVHADNPDEQRRLHVESMKSRFPSIFCPINTTAVLQREEWRRFCRRIHKLFE